MGVVYKLGRGMWVWFINWGMACGCGNMVPETISKKLRPMSLLPEVSAQICRREMVYNIHTKFKG